MLSSDFILSLSELVFHCDLPRLADAVVQNRSLVDCIQFLLMTHFVVIIVEMSADDEAVRATNDDAASCKRSAVQLGYWSDPYVQLVTKPSDHKPPEISRGYFARVRSVQGLIRQFLQVC